jgi:hypothetical protein
MGTKLMQTQIDGYWLAALGVVQSVTCVVVTWRFGLSDPIGIAALFLAGLMLGIALAALAILNERMKINRIFGIDVYDPKSKETIGKTTKTQA